MIFMSDSCVYWYLTIAKKFPLKYGGKIDTNYLDMCAEQCVSIIVSIFVTNRMPSDLPFSILKIFFEPINQKSHESQ